MTFDPIVLTDLRVLFCADPLTPGRFDEHFAAEVAAVQSLGGTTAAIDHDALLGGDADRAVRRVPRDSGTWWYRGWMIPTSAYRLLAEALVHRGVSLRVPPRRYRLAHELPGWYPTFAEVTPESAWFGWEPGLVPTTRDVSVLASYFPSDSSAGPAVVKDYVKSRKHEWHEAFFIPDLADVDHAAAVIGRMVELQEESLNGGIVLRRFESYLQEQGRTAETRVWWVDGKPAMITAHPDTPDQWSQPDLTAIGPLVVALGCPFVTTDVARRADGAWRVVEVGDGQVSDLPAGADSTVLFQRLAEPSTIDGPVLCPHCGGVATPVLYGRPMPAASAAAARGDLELYGCFMPEDPPQWACRAGHEWTTSEPHWIAAVNAAIDDDEA